LDDRTVGTLIQSSVESIKISRNIFLIVLILSALHIVAAYNLYFSWLRTIALLDNLSTGTVIQQNQENLLRWWVDSTFINIPVLGIRVHSADASLAGSVLITFFMLATLFAMRKQNHTIGQAVRRVARTLNLDQMRYAYYTLSNALIFTPMSNNDEAIATLSDPDETRPTDRIPGIRLMISTVFFIPGTAILFDLIADVLSIVWIRSPFRDAHPTVWEAISGDGLTIARAAFMMLIAVILGILCMFWGARCRKYQEGNHLIVKRLSEEIHKRDTADPPSASEPELTGDTGSSASAE
jgi:hypothetical protein